MKEQQELQRTSGEKIEIGRFLGACCKEGKKIPGRKK
jgi:hypothetical protein